MHPDEKTEKEGKGGMSVEVSSAGEAHRPDTAFSPSVASLSCRWEVGEVGKTADGWR